MLQKISNEGDADNARNAMAKMFGPGHIDQQIRQAIGMCWMALPKDRQKAEVVEKEFRDDW